MKRGNRSEMSIYVTDQFVFTLLMNCPQSVIRYFVRCIREQSGICQPAGQIAAIQILEIRSSPAAVVDAVGNEIQFVAGKQGGGRLQMAAGNGKAIAGKI